MNEKIEILEEQLNIINSDPNPDPMVKIKVLNDLAWEFRHIDLNRACQYGRQVQKLLERHPHPGEQVRCYAALAEICYGQGDYQQALLVGNAALTLAEQVDMDYLRPYVFSSLGLAQWALGDLAEGLAYFQQQHQTSQQLGDKINEAEALNNVGLIHASTGDWDSAHEAFQQALALYEMVQDKKGQAIALNNMAMSPCNTADYSPAQENVLRALELVQSVGNQTVELAVLDTVGQVYLKQKKYLQALAYFQQSIELADEIGVEAPESLMGIGRLYALQSDKDKALMYLHQALQVLETGDKKKELFGCHQLLSEIYEGQGDPVMALQHYKQFYTVKEQVFNEDADRKLKYLQVSYETETARKEAEIYRLRNVELQAALDQVKQLSGLLPICANCKNIRDDTGYWQDVAVYIRDHSEAEFSHGICPECTQELYPDCFKILEERKRKIIDTLAILGQASIEEITTAIELSGSDVLNSLNVLVRDRKVVRLQVDNQDYYKLS